MKKEKLLFFDVASFSAHFRKIYSTTSSLSYYFPPRTTVCGLIAAILGRDRDSYYEEFLNYKIGLGILTPLRKITQTVNFLMTDEEALNEFRKDGKWIIRKHAQIRQETILPDEGNIIRYRIFFAGEILDELYKKIRKNSISYPIYLGTSNNLAWIESSSLVESKIFRSDDFFEISTVIPISSILDIKITGDLELIREERVPAEFNSKRKLKRIEDYFFERRGKAICARVKDEIFSFEIDGKDFYGVFM